MKLARFAAVCVMACGASKPVLTPPAPAVGQLLHDVTDAYAKVSSYRDSGTVELTVGATTTRATFTVARIAGTAMRLELDRDGHLPVIAWTDGHDADIVQDGKLAVGRGKFDRDVGAVVSRILRQASDGASPFVETPAPAVESREPIDGHTCLRVAGHSMHGPLTAWIDEREHVVRRTVEKLPAAYDTDITVAIDYKPELNAAIADVELARPVAPPEQPQWIGVAFRPGGATIERVYQDSPAAKAGFQPNDSITKLDSKPIDVGTFRAAMAGSRPGASYAVTIERAGKEVTLHVTPAPRPELDALQQGLVDKPAPPFALARIAGTTSPKLADLAGDVVIVDFWATWCGPCRMSMPHLDALAAKYATNGLRIIGVTDEDAATVNEFLKVSPVGYTLASDPDDAIASAYLVQGLPTLMVLDRSGVVRYMQTGVGDFSALDAKIAELLAQPAKPSNLPP